MALVRCEGVILRVRDYGEADRIITVLSGPEGKFDAVARGARRPRSRMVGVTQQFSQAALLLFRGKNLDTLSTAELVSAHLNLSSDVLRMAYASYVAELIDKMTGERERNDHLYHLVVATFDALDSLSCDPAHVALAFEVKFMSLIGFRPELWKCVGCGASAEASGWFGPEAGGLLCDRCRQRDRGNVPFGTESRQAAIAMLTLGYGQICLEMAEPGGTTQLQMALRSYVDHRVERRLRSLDFIEDLRTMERGENR
ncbi:MAG: DNA repair protein RecO [Clostridia bacterium]|nr:DNA repair protein RecO [Clostridia bacterium]